jgi:Methyltransferase domain
MQATQTLAQPPLENALETTFLTPNYRADLRTGAPDVFVDESTTAYGSLDWKTIGRPYEVKNISKDRQKWEREHGPMPVVTQWQQFNQNFHAMFSQDVPARLTETSSGLLETIKGLDLAHLGEELQEWLEVRLWNKVHRVEDAIWDPRGKRALFDGLELSRPRILFLGAAEGYEAMQLSAMYPGGEVVLVDYDAFCRDERFEKFPEAYPFLGQNPATGAWNVYHRPDFNVHYVVEDIRDLSFGPEFDVVLSVGLLEHFPDSIKPQVVDWHRKFVKPGGYVIMTTPRKQFTSLIWYRVMERLMNYGYRELMTSQQLSLYAYENGLEILRSGYIKAHNGLIARAR